MHSSLFPTARPTPAHRRKRNVLAAAALAASGLAFQPAAVLAQPSANAAAATAAGASQRYDIPDGPLGAVLNRFAQRAGIALSYPPELAEGKRSPGVSGEYTVPAAFEALLQGTGLRAVGDGSGSYSLRSAPQQVMNPGASAGSTVLATGSLAEVRITTNAENDAWGPVNGYIARRSATATKTDTAIAETPFSISVVGSEQMDRQNALKTEQALRYEAGVRTELADDLRHQNVQT